MSQGNYQQLLISKRRKSNYNLILHSILQLKFYLINFAKFIKEQTSTNHFSVKLRPLLFTNFSV